MKKYIIIGLSSFVMEIGSTFYITYVADKNFLGMSFFAFIGPFLGLPFVGFMIESKTWKMRLKLALTSSIGYTLGSWCTYSFIN
jgi:hypothetical protein